VRKHFQSFTTNFFKIQNVVGQIFFATRKHPKTDQKATVVFLRGGNGINLLYCNSQIFVERQTRAYCVPLQRGQKQS
jgi:hypothetical protein